MSNLVSVIIPTYNRAHLIKRTLQSIIGQTYKNLEIIVVADGTLDNTAEVVESLGDPRVTYIDQKHTGGCSSPRNRGMQLARGHYIAFCDDDDVWLPEKLEKQIHVLESHPDYIGCYTNSVRFDSSKEWFVPHENGNTIFKNFLYYNTIPISSLVVRHEVLENVGYFNENPQVGSAEDYEYLLRVLVRFKLYHVNEVLMKYWSDSNRMTTETMEFKSSFKYFFYIIYSFFSVLKKENISVFIFFWPFLFHLYNLMKRSWFLIKVSLSISKGL